LKINPLSSVFFSNIFCLLTIGNEDGYDSDSEKGNHRPSRKPLMRTLTNADNKLTIKQSEQDQVSPRMPNWRHSKANFNRLRSLDLSETGQGDHAAHTNAIPSSHRSRAQNAFNKFVHQSMDFARRRCCCFFIDYYHINQHFHTNFIS
jgi:hypothetical protein